MILTTLLLLAAQATPTPTPAPTPTLAAPTLAAIEEMSPEAAGQIVLTGRDHGPIAELVVPAGRSLGPPGMVERQLVERPVAGPEGCSRRRWITRFSHGPNIAQSQAALSGVSATTEVALAGPAGCPDEGYVHLNPGLEAAQAFPALKYLDDLRLRDAQARFTCSDETASGLCADPGKIRRSLAKLTPWAATRRDGEMVFWLGAPGQVVTEVRYRLAQPDQVTIARRVPAPF